MADDAKLRASATPTSKTERRERASRSHTQPHLNATASLALGYLGCSYRGAFGGAFRCLCVGRWRTHLGRRRGAEGKCDTYEQDGEARASVRVAHMAPYFMQLRGQAKGTHCSGPLPASLASATCPLLRGTPEGSGASCALTGTRGTGCGAAEEVEAQWATSVQLITCSPCTARV